MKELFNKLPSPWNYITMVAAVIVLFVAAWILTRINKRVFKRIQQSRKEIHIVFFEKVTASLIVIGVVIIAFSVVDSVSSVWKTLLGGTAIISAVLAFAAQDVIKDILAGMMISIHKPFEIGDRIELEDGTAGIVENITLRHVVLINIDTLRIIIPNSKLNSLKLVNLSVGEFDRSAHFRFSVGYDTDIALAKRVIFEAVKESEYSIPVARVKGDAVKYPPVYFMRFADSALILEVTVYYEKCFTTETVINDINTRVREALMANGIEIPYNYVTVVNKESK